MTPKQEQHLRSLLDYLASATDMKYRKGQEEHGGDLWGMSCAQLLDNAIDEAIDLSVYLITLKQKLRGECGCHVKH